LNAYLNAHCHLNPNRMDLSVRAQRVAVETYEEAQQQLETCLEHRAATVTLENGLAVPVAADSHIRCAGGVLVLGVI
jgi:hypothetical protein